MRRSLLNVVIFVAVLLTLGTAKYTKVWAVECNHYDYTIKDYNVEYPTLSMEKVGPFDKVINMINSFVLLLTGKRPDTFERCSAQALKSKITVGDSCTVALTSTGTDPCEDIGILNPNGGLTGYNFNKTNGSLLSLATTLDQVVKSKDPIPVNLAYYVNRNAEKIPFVGTAYAAQVTYGGPFLGFIYDTWTLTRNIAFGLMAVVMLVVGILIVSRKKISAQASVTVQQALPQVIIAVILITFSYPIGAAGASLAFNLRGSMEALARGSTELQVNIPNTAFITFWGGIGGLVSGVVSLIMGFLSLLITLVTILLVLVATMSIYLKMLFAIITAPISFALGAIPGYQDTTVNWFKQYLAWMVGLPAMSFILYVTTKLVTDLGVQSVTNYDNLGGWGWGMLAGLALPVITLFGCSLALKTPGKIEEVLGVGAAGGKRK